MTGAIVGGSVRGMALQRCSELGCTSLVERGVCLPCREYNETQAIDRAVKTAASLAETERVGRERGGVYNQYGHRVGAETGLPWGSTR